MKFAFRYLMMAAGLLGSCSATAQTLMTIGGEPVSRQEFLRAFKKNNTDSTLNETAVKDYLELFIRFKLKVKAARLAKIDSLPTHKAELAEFSSQLSEAYLVDEESYRRLLEEAVQRSKKDIHLAHILIPFGGDTALAARQANAASQALKQGVSFEKIAADFGNDKNGGDMGFITLFTLPYRFENVAYSLSSGTFSAPVKSSLGYHIFKNLGERSAVGKMRVAQILFALRPDPTDSMISRYSKLADSVYMAIANGASFEEMVRKYTDDNTSLNVGGELPAFAPGTYDPAFENAVFSLTNDGQVSRPVRSSFGFHLIKRIERIPVELSSDSANTALADQVKRNERMEVSKQAFLKKIYSVTGFREFPMEAKKFQALSDSVFSHQKPASAPGDILFSMGAEKRSFRDWAKYLLDVKNIASLSTGKSINDLYTQFKDVSATEYYRNNLSKYNPEYAAQLKEFKEGNMLFEMMQRTIWDKASLDSIGQLQYYKQHRNTYQWKPSADAIIFSALDSVSATGLYAGVNKDLRGWRNAGLSFADKAQSDSGRYELDQLPVANPAVGKLTQPVRNEGGSNIYSFLYLIKMYPGNTPKSFEEARGTVLSDYQQDLEDRWITSLKKKYPVVVNSSVFKSITR